MIYNQFTVNGYWCDLALVFKALLVIKKGKVLKKGRDKAHFKNGERLKNTVNLGQ